MLTRLIPGFTLIALLSACSAPTVANRSRGSVGDAVSAADVAVQAGQREKAIGILQGAALAHPADKGPWVRMAEICYEAGDYGQAIVNAQQALHRDPDDMVAHSVAAVSGLRVASTALADLTRKHNLAGTVRSEAQDLAKLLRASLGEGVLVPGASTAIRPATNDKKSVRNPGGPIATSPRPPPSAAKSDGRN